MGKVTYVVGATPRSGSTLLCALLAARPALFAERLPELRYVHGTRGDYEAPAADAPAAAGAVLDHVGTGRAEIPEPPLRRQGDDGSARWVERFRGEREAVAR